jgi:ADP-heptose:LPS heptosyltransferase
VKTNAAQNILLIRFKSIGDILFTLPAVNLVRDSFPQARITFLVSREHAAILQGFAGVDSVLTLDRKQPWWKLVAAVLTLTRQLRRERFSLAVDFQGYGETAALTWLTRAPQRWGSVYRSGRAWAYTHGIKRNDQQHPAAWNLSLLHQCGLAPQPVRNEFRLAPEAAAAAAEFFAAHGLQPERPTLYLQPFTSSPHKNWPLENYLAVAQHWKARGVQLIVSGGPADRPALEPARQMGCTVAAGVPRMTDIGLMSLCTLVVGGDTGFLHLAVALDKRVLMLMRLAGPGSTVPFGHPDWVVAPPGKAPIAAIEVGQVIQACASVLPTGV